MEPESSSGVKKDILDMVKGLSDSDYSDLMKRLYKMRNVDDEQSGIIESGRPAVQLNNANTKKDKKIPKKQLPKVPETDANVVTNQNHDKEQNIEDGTFSQLKISQVRSVGIRRSNRKRKAVEDDDFIFDPIGQRETPAIPELQIISTISEENCTEKENFEDQNEENSPNQIILTEDISESENAPIIVELENPSLDQQEGINEQLNDENKIGTSRIGAVLALDEWKCKFCGKTYHQIPEFAIHLVDHYKSVGAARTEKSRLQRESGHHDKSNIDLKLKVEEDDEDSQDEGLNTSESYDELSIDGKLPKFPYYCDICVKKKIFNRAEYLIRHLRKHSGELSCTRCTQVFFKQEELDSHICIKVEEAKLNCSICNKAFRTMRFLKQHLETIHPSENAKVKSEEPPPIKTSRKKDKITTKPDLESGDKDSVVVLYKCEVCEQTFTRLSTLEKHLKSHGFTFACKNCSKPLTNQNMKLHQSICDAILSFTSGEGDLKCPKCGIIFLDIDKFRYHLGKHTHPYMCSKCHLRLTSNSEIKTHECSSFDCDGCSESFSTLVDLKRHIEESENEKIEFFCFECAYPFVTQDGFMRHKGCEVDPAVGSESKRPKIPKKEGNPEGLFICEKCGVSYTKWSSLKTHRYTHGPKRHMCEICGKAFHRREMLADHQFVHQDAQFKCLECDKKMKSKKSLDVHMHIHAGLKRFQCSTCGKGFTQKINLVTHEQIHLPADKKGYRCSECGKKFASKEYLGFHLDAHQNGKNQVCDICGKSFIKPHMLNQHKRTAHGNQKYTCEYCNLSVRQKHSLMRHLRKRHEAEEDSWNQSGYIESRFVPGDGTYIHTSQKKASKKSESMIELEAVETDDSMGGMTLVLNKDNESDELETEEISFSGENVIIPEHSNMVILQVAEGEIVLSLTSALHAGSNYVEQIFE